MNAIKLKQNEPKEYSLYNYIMSTKTCKKCDKTLSIAMYSKHSGTKDKLDNRCKDCVKKCVKNYRINGKKEHPIYNLDMNNINWQLGKSTGCILYRKRNNRFYYEARIKLSNGKLKSKSFPKENFEEANKWLKEFAKENNLTNNMIRIIDDNTIEVQLTKNYIMKTDIKYADICQKYSLCAGKGGSKTSKYYAKIEVDGKSISYHKYITGYSMTDHINRDTLDNRLINLRKTTYKQNNNNRGQNKKITDPSHILGVRRIDSAWEARIKQDGKQYTSWFSIAKYGDEGAKNMAIEARKQFNIRFNCSNS